MTYPKNERTERICAGVLLALTAVFIVLVAYQTQHRDADIFWALEAGRWIAEHLRVPLTDPFSYTFAEAPWIDFTWGFQVIAHLFYTHLGGWTGLFILQVLLTGGAFYALYLNMMITMGGRVAFAATLVLVVFAGAYSRLFIRPHLFGFLFITLYLLLLNLHEKKGRAVFLFALLPLQVLWVNIHSSAVLGVFILGAYASGEIIDGVRREGLHYLLAIPRSTKRLIIVSLILPFASIVNPYGLKLALFPFIHQAGNNADALRHIGEWVRLPARELFFTFYPYPLNHFAFKVLFYSAIISFLFNLRRVRARDLMLFGAAAYMAATHIRWMGQFGFFAAPVIVSNLSGCIGGGRLVEKRLRLWLTLGAGGVIAILMIRVLFWGPFRDNYGLGVRDLNYPAGTVEFMKREKIGGHIYNDYIFGGYLIFTNPSVKVFIDGRTPTVYSPYFFWTTRLAGIPERWSRLTEEHGITTALVKIGKTMCGNLYKDPAWTPVAFDDVSVLYLKKALRNRDLVKRWGMDLNPCSDKDQYELPEGEAKLEEMRRALEKVLPAIEPGGVRFSRPHRLLGLVETEIGTEDALLDAAGEFKKALSVSDDSYTNYDLGITLGKLNKDREAAIYFRRSVNKDKGFKKARLALGLTLYDMKDYGNAALELERYVRMADDHAEFAAYKALGRAYFNLSKFAHAERVLKRAAFLAGDKDDIAEVYYYLGNALFEVGRYGRGARYYRLALSSRPEYAKVLTHLAGKLQDRGKKEAARQIQNLITEPTQPNKDPGSK